MITTLLLDADGVTQHNAGFRDRMGALLGGPEGLAAVMALELTALTGETDFDADLAAHLGDRGLAVTVPELYATWFATRPDPEVLALADRVRAGGAEVYLATNQQPARGRHMQRTLGYERHLDGQFHSWELGVAKPARGFFEAILGRLDRRPHEVLFVDDMEPNVEGARAAGLVAEHLPHGAGTAGLAAILVRHGLLDRAAGGF